MKNNWQTVDHELENALEGVRKSIELVIADYIGRIADLADDELESFQISFRLQIDRLKLICKALAIENNERKVDPNRRRLRSAEWYMSRTTAQTVFQWLDSCASPQSEGETITGLLSEFDMTLPCAKSYYSQWLHVRQSDRAHLAKRSTETTDSVQ